MSSSIKGFTLMEVLVALIVLSIAFSAIFKSISFNVNSLLYLENKSAANWVGLNVLTLTQLKLIDLQQSSSPRKDWMLNKYWYWNAKMKNTPNPGILRIEVSVSEFAHTPPLASVTGFLINE